MHLKITYIDSDNYLVLHMCQAITRSNDYILYVIYCNITFIFLDNYLHEMFPKLLWYQTFISDNVE